MGWNVTITRPCMTFTTQEFDRMKKRAHELNVFSINLTNKIFWR